MSTIYFRTLISKQRNIYMVTPWLLVDHTHTDMVLPSTRILF